MLEFFRIDVISSITNYYESDEKNVPQSPPNLEGHSQYPPVVHLSLTIPSKAPSALQTQLMENPHAELFLAQSTLRRTLFPLFFFLEVKPKVENPAWKMVKLEETTKSRRGEWDASKKYNYQNELRSRGVEDLLCWLVRIFDFDSLHLI